MNKHTKGRLKMRQGFEDGTKELYVPDSSIKKPFEPTAIATVSADDAEGMANARRLVACWNACIDIRTEALKDEAPSKMREDRDQLQAQCNGLLEALKEVTEILLDAVLGFSSEPSHGSIAAKARAAIAAAKENK